MTADLIVDLFAGPGGWSTGIEDLGLRDIGLEWDTAACKTRAAAGHLTIQCDVAQYPTEPFKGRTSGLIGSPPCQAWSRAGKGLGLVDQPLVHQAVHDLSKGRETRSALLAACKDPRSLLAAEPMRWLYDLRPEWTAMEEVPDVLPLWRQYAEVLRGWGYSVWCGVLNAADYGVPQTRRRAILIASRVRTVTAPTPTHTQHPAGEDLFGESLPGWVSMADALGWGATDRVAPTVTADGGKTGGAEPFPTQARQALLDAQERGAWVLRSRRDSPKWIATDGPRENRRADQPAPTFTGEAHRWSWALERPATTACATNRIAPPGHRDRSPGGESQFSSSDTVRVTVPEAAALQSFPADYPWQGTKTKQFEQIGNAVPPLLAAHIVSAATGLSVPARDAEVAA
ncbi:DNA cytosine methyltransferase [Nonomuraea indica]|uniref:DNA cytosine methyltransferase n=1 Tax=Nonomuraea indica TaxID=1581193 RepID=UPI000C7DFCF8|nr:DNA cytosine methyltransferase [Nonomuraea indica]